MLLVERDLPKNGYVLPPETVGATHRMEKENGQNHALKKVAFPREVSLSSATVAALEGSHRGTPGRQTGYSAGQLAYHCHNTTGRGELRISPEDSAWQPKDEACKSSARRGNVRGVV